MAETILVLLTGGTIDSFYDVTKDTVVANEKSIIPDFVESLKIYQNIEFLEVCMKDSRDLNENDLKKIVDTIEQSKHKKILITHGTYTMSDTGRYIKANLKRNDQTIVLTGSMLPIVGFAPSDGPFSLGFSLAKLESLDPGVYACMNGRVFSPDELIKITKEGRFHSVFGEK